MCNIWPFGCLINMNEVEEPANRGRFRQGVGSGIMSVAENSLGWRLHANALLLALLAYGSVLSQETPGQPGSTPPTQGKQSPATNKSEGEAAFAHTEALLQYVHTDESKDGNPSKDFDWIETKAVEVQRRGASTTQPVTAGAVVYPQDTVVTGPRTIAQLRFSDGTLVVVGRDARLRVAERQIAGRLIRTGLVLYQGIVRVRASRFAARGSFTLQTPAAVFEFPETSGLVVRHTKATDAEDQGCTVGTLVSGHVKAHGIGKALQEKTFDLLEPGDVAHFCTWRHEKEDYPKRFLEAALLALTDEVPFFVDGKAKRRDDFELPSPETSLPGLAGGDQEFPELPGVQVPPPLILDTPPFDFAPTIPDLIPVDEISP